MRVYSVEDIEKLGPSYMFAGHTAMLCFECAKKAIGGEDSTLLAYRIGLYEPELCTDCGKEIKNR